MASSLYACAEHAASFTFATVYAASFTLGEVWIAEVT